MTSLDKALHILDVLCEQGQCSIKHLAQRTGYPAPTVHRLLQVLVRNSFVTHHSRTKDYALSLKHLEFGARVRADLRLASLVMPALRELMELSGETVNLVVFEHYEAIYVEQVVNPRSMLPMFTRIGARTPLYCSGVGKAYLAAQNAHFIHQYCEAVPLQEKTRYTLVREQDLMADLENIRHQGYATDNEEMEYGVRCVAALIHQSPLVIMGSISISGPAARISTEKLSQLGVQVRRAAQEISTGLGFKASPGAKDNS